MLAAALALAVAGAPPARLLVLELEAVGVDKTEARAVDPVVLNAAAGAGLEVIAQSEIKTLATVEAQKAEIGCDSSSCLAELAGAMGAGYVLFGSVSKLGSTTTVALSLYDNTSAAVTRDSVAVEDLGTLPRLLPPRVRALVHKAAGTVATAGTPATTTTTTTTTATTTATQRQAAGDDDAGPLLYAGLAGVFLGGTALLGGGVLATLNELTIDDPHALAATKRSAQETGTIGLIAVAAGLVVGGAGAAALVLQ